MRRKLIEMESGYGLRLTPSELEALGISEGGAVFVRVAQAEGDQPARIIIRRATSFEQAMESTFERFDGTLRDLAKEE